VNSFYVENLSVSFDGFKALNLKTFELKPGELRVIIGPNGAGKSTFLDVLCGKTAPTTGKVMMDSKDLTKLSEREIVQAGVGRKFQNPTIFPSLTVFDNLAITAKCNKGVLATLFRKRTAATEATIDEIAETIGLKDRLQWKAGALSHGQKQWLEIGMVMAQDPILMLIDEPAAGMSDDETYRTGELLKSLAGERTLIVIEHDMEFVRQIASKVTVFAEGKLLVEGDMDTVKNDPRVIECYLGSREGGHQ